MVRPIADMPSHLAACPNLEHCHPGAWQKLGASLSGGKWERAAKRLFHLVCQLICPIAVASREVEWNEAGDTRSFGDMTRLVRRQMPSFGGDIGVHVEERCLNEELIGIPR